MPRAPIAGVLYLVIGCAIAGGVIFVMGSVVEMLIDEPWTRVSLGAAVTYTMLSGVFGWLALRALQFARTSLLPYGWSQDGEVKVEFVSPPCVGHKIEGRLWLKREARVGETFRIRLRCDRIEVFERGSGANLETRQQVEHLFYEEREGTAAGGAGPSSIPFEFDVPDSAPSTPPLFTFVRTPPHILFTRHPPRWYLEIVVPKSLLGTTPEIDFEMGLAPRAEPIGPLRI